MLCQQRYADSPSQFTFLGTYTPVWLTFKWAKSQSNRWAKWQETKMLWMYIVWVWRVKLPVRDIQVNTHHTAMWRQHRDMPWIAKFKMSSVTAASIDRKTPVNGCRSRPCSGGIQEGIAMERWVQRKMTFPLTKPLLPSSIMIPSGITGEDFIQHEASSRESLPFVSQESFKMNTESLMH